MLDRGNVTQMILLAEPRPEAEAQDDVLTDARAILPEVFRSASAFVASWLVHTSFFLVRTQFTIFRTFIDICKSGE